MRVSPAPDVAANQVLSGSPALIIDRADGDWYQVIGADGTVGWTTLKRAARTRDVTLRPRTDELDYTNLSPEHQSSASFEWGTLSGRPQGVVTAATPRFYTETPQYIRRTGRGNSLDDRNNPFNRPLLQVHFDSVSAWVPSSSLALTWGLDGQLRTPLDSTDARGLQGLVLPPFLTGLGVGDFAPAAEAEMLDLTYQEIKKRLTPALRWTTIEALVRVDEANPDALGAALLLTSEENGYCVAVMSGRGHVRHFIFYSEEAQVPTPLLTGYGHEDTNGDDIRDLVLNLSMISGDDVQEERVVIDGGGFLQGELRISR